jgi:uncharacterized protein YbjT (DUF2867 family)
MRVAIIGGTGFVGGYLSNALLDSGHSVSLLVRQGSEGKLSRAKKVQIVNGSLSDNESILRVLTGCDAAIYNVGILREFPSKGVTFEAMQHDGLVSTVDAALAVGVRRLLLMSANGVKRPGTAYQETKRRAEIYALKSGLDVTVFRPSIIFGDPHEKMEFATQLYNDMVRPPFPAVNFFSAYGSKDGSIVMSPVHINDVTSAFIAALQNDECFGKTYALGGPEVLTWKEMIVRVAAATGRHKWFLPMPTALMRIGAALLDRLAFFPVTRDQLTMLEEGNVADVAVLRSLINREPTPFSIDNLQYLNN